MATVTNSLPRKSKSSIPSFAKAGKWLAVLLVIILAAIGFYLYRHHQNQHKAKVAAQPYAYTYSKVAAYKLSGWRTGSGIKLNLPVEFGKSGTSTNNTERMQFTQIATSGSTVAIVAQLQIASVKVPTPPTAAYLKSLSSSIVNPKSSSFSSVTKPLKNYVTQRLSTNYSVTFVTPVALKTTYLKSNAWSMGFTATVKNSAKTAAYPPFDGQAVLAVGQTAFYYFMASAVSYNWQSNQHFWNGVINSLQIDQ